MEQKEMSNAPMVLGIIAGVLGLPAAYCTGACATCAAVATKAPDEVGVVAMWVGLIPAVLGLISAFLYKKNPKIWGAMMLLAAVLSGGLTVLTFNFLSLTVCILFLIGGAIAVTQKKPSVS